MSVQGIQVVALLAALGAALEGAHAAPSRPATEAAQRAAESPASESLGREASYLEGRRHGLWREWNADGQPREEGWFEEGRRQGPWNFWESDGTLGLRSGNYEAGRRSRD